MTKHTLRQLFALPMLFVLATATPSAGELRPTPLRPDHPILGSWRIDLPGGCFEVYKFLPSGTKLSRSAGERNTAVFEISAQPSGNGFYHWVDEITETNHKPDCSNSMTPLGDVSENFILMEAGGRRFRLCEREDRNSCYGEFRKIDDDTI
jgi:hypothetical protein